MTEPDPQDLRRLLDELAGAAPTAVDRASVARLAVRRRAGLLTGAASVVAVSGLLAALVLKPSSATDTLEPAPQAVQPSGSVAPTPSPTATPAPTLEPSATPTPEPTPEPASDPSSDPESTGSPAPPAPARPAGLPSTFYAADTSRVAAYRTSDGARTSWLSPERDGFGASSLALWDDAVLYGLGNGETQGVYAIGRPPRGDDGPGSLSDPGGFRPAVLPDGSRYAFLASGDDAAYTPRSPDDLRLVLTQESGGVQAIDVDASALIGGLAFASPDRLVLAYDRATADPVGSGLQVYDFQTDEARLGERAPDERFLPPPAGCAWTLPTATPAADEVLVLQRCSREDGGDSEAVVVDIATGKVVAGFGTLLPAGPGQVDSLDLDRTGKHLIAQIHDGGAPVPRGSSQPPRPDRPVLETRRLPGGQTITTTTSLVSPVWD